MEEKNADSNSDSADEDNKDRGTVDWKELFGENSFMTDLGELQNEIRYAVWVFKDDKHHVVRVGPDKKELQTRFKISDQMIFKFDEDHVQTIADMETKKKRKNWNSGSRLSRDRSDTDNERRSKKRGGRARL